MPAPSPETLTKKVPASLLLARLNSALFIGPCAVALATLARLSLEPLLQKHGPYLLFAVAVAAAALYGGIWAGISATVLSIPVCDYLFVEPRYTWFLHDASGDSIMLALFAALSVLLTVIIERFHNVRRSLKQSLVDLQRVESKLENMTATVPEILFTATDQGAADYVNSHFAKYCGRELSELAGRGWLEIIHAEDRPGMETELCRSSDNRNEFQTTIRLRRSDGVYRWFKCHARRVSDPDTHEKRWFGVCSDIDNEKSLTAALESRTEELLRLNAALERFAYAAFHDLQEPLRTVGAMTESLLSHSGASLDAEASEVVGSVAAGVERMKRLIGDMMHFARAGNLSNQQPSAETDAGAVAGLAMANLGEAIRESAANIVVAPLPAVYANESALLRVFQNLMANAIKYRGEKSPQVRVSAEQRNQEWVFSIRDNGIGIDPAYHATIFEPFHRLHARSKYDGSGLGLAACRRIVASWRGRIWVESQPGEGSTFFFTIPADAVPGSAPAERKPSGKEERLLEQARRTAGAGEF